MLDLRIIEKDYHLEWVDTIRSSTDNHISHIKNIELSDNWLNIDVATPGTLGVEVLYLVNILNDVELLKVIGTINETDWTSIKNYCCPIKIVSSNKV